MKFELPKLEYKYDSLEPVIDEQTMTIHHDKHHQAYTDKLNAALEKHPELKIKNAEEMLKNLNKIPEDIRTAVKNNGGGYVNHSFFWNILKKDVRLNGKIKNEIEKKFKSFDKFKEEFTSASIGLFGSGWCWLVINENRELEIITTANQDSPLSIGKIPVLVIDLWEHAYYLKYQNKRAEYISAFWDVVDWDKVNKNFVNAVK
ncbi:superoxide dismutase [Candidatus Pacearchaeota archaeon RBG_19FT_COMBO_34_9]|nr:MAG: superoxide dismutase [Candidatus Pacearchaeota archaeon RBG_19FT_COMBO_34_9]OGJ16340.1 MAG: superoxide dismutase [Candidatus Pacearchaeota archaeon RBG_13_33_26]